MAASEQPRRILWTCVAVAVWHAATMVLMEHGWRRGGPPEDVTRHSSILKTRPEFDVTTSRAFLSNDSYAYLFGPHGPDNRVEEWFLLENEAAPLLITVAYLAVVPLLSFMRASFGALSKDGLFSRAVTCLSLLHNAILFSLSAYMTAETLRCADKAFGWRGSNGGGDGLDGGLGGGAGNGGGGGTLFCNLIDNFGGSKWGSDEGEALANVLYVHYLSKAYEFADTMIIVLKGNFQQVTFLHVMHHATAFFPVWFLNMRYAPGGDAWFCCFLSSLAHTIMYGHHPVSEPSTQLTNQWHHQ